MNRKLRGISESAHVQNLDRIRVDFDKLWSKQVGLGCFFENAPKCWEAVCLKLLMELVLSDFYDNM